MLKQLLKLDFIDNYLRQREAQAKVRQYSDPQKPFNLTLQDPTAPFDVNFCTVSGY